MKCGLCLTQTEAGVFPKNTTSFAKPYVPKNWTRKLLLIKESPGGEGDLSDKLLWSMLQAAGYAANDVAVGYAARGRPAHDKAPSMSQLRSCRAFLLRVISGLGPEYIIGVGTPAAKALTNDGEASVTGLRGRRISIPGYEGSAVATVTYSPGSILRGKAEFEHLITEDLRWPFKPELDAPDWGVPQGTTIAFDTEWARDGRLLTVGVADTRVAWAWETTDESWKSYVEHVFNRATTLLGHSLPQDIDKVLPFVTKALASKLVAGQNQWDSLLLARMVDENKLSYRLEDVLLSTYRTGEWKSKSESLLRSTGDMSSVDTLIRRNRCALDAWAPARLIKDYMTLIESDCQKASISPARFSTILRLTHSQAQAIHRIWLAGGMVSSTALASLGIRARAESEKWQNLSIRQTTSVGGRLDFKPTNDNHVRELVYETLGMPVREHTANGLAAVDRVTLATILTDLPPTTDGTEKRTVLETLLKFGKVDKYLDYVEELEEYSTPRGSRADKVPLRVLPFRINPLGAKTGRRSSSEPNSQNLAETLRQVFVSRWPGGQVANFDYSGLEVVLIGWESKEEKLLHAFTVGRKYIDVAKWMLGLDIEEGSDTYKLVKAAVLSLNYRKTKRSFGRDLWRKFGLRLAPNYRDHQTEAAKIHDKYFRTFPGLVDYLGRREDEVRHTGQVVSATGRIRHLPLPDGENTPGFEHVLNMAVNFPIQSLASDVTGCALLDIEEALCAVRGETLLDHHLALLDWKNNLLTWEADHEIIPPKYGTVCFNEVHDSLVFDVDPATQDRDLALIQECMVASKTLRKVVPGFDPKLKVGVKVAPEWRSK